MTKTIPGIFLTAALVMLAACGTVITPQPTGDSPAASTPIPTSWPTPRLTATAPLLPPVATATPTVTPVPVIYVVQSGDTLFSIAFEYGVSPDDLQAANGIEDPQFLSIGQELTIPTEEESADSTSNLLLPTPTPLPLGVRGIAFYETPVGSLFCFGEVVNTTASTLTNVQMRVVLFDEAGDLLTETDAFATADLVPPGERSPFGVLFTTPPPAWASSQVVIIRGEVAGGLAASFVPVTVRGVEGQPSGSQFQVSGVVENTSTDQTAGKVDVIVTSYDPEGLVTGFRQGRVELEGALTPGATAPFTVLFSFQGDTPADFHVTALGRVSAE